ncbi:hypothetical protein [Haloarchaeobius sp. DFWS5]|uniref:hypothetical protein n=1 Tax=Haloarchaeobius sp. DFWS5 TaxID=3446114 RepID=UPI003EBCFFF0
MSSRQTPVILESEMSPVDRNGSLQLTIDKAALKNAGINPDDWETVPEKFIQHYHKGGKRDGVLEIDLKGAADDVE